MSNSRFQLVLEDGYPAGDDAEEGKNSPPVHNSGGPADWTKAVGLAWYHRGAGEEGENSPSVRNSGGPAGLTKAVELTWYHCGANDM